MTTTTEETVAKLASRLVEKHFEGTPFQKPYELEDFVAPEDALLTGLLKQDLRIPKDPCNKSENVACLLLHDLHKLSKDHLLSSSKVSKWIDDTRDTCSALYGTSGAGKTRSVYEYLSANYGLYFVASTKNDPGSKDLYRLIQLFATLYFASSSLNADTNDAAMNITTSQRNYLAMNRLVIILIHVRNLIFNAINNQLEMNKRSRLTPYQWLLIQLFPTEALKTDLFLSVFRECMIAAINNDKDDSVERAFVAFQPQEWSTVVVDEAQVLLDNLQCFFMCSKGKSNRSAFSAVLKGIANAAESARDCGFPLVCGTGLSIDDLKEQSSSVTGKRPLSLSANRENVFKEFSLLSADQVKTYLLSFLEIKNAAESTSLCVSDASVIDHVSKWLRGRPRWTASFLEVYLVRKPDDNYAASKSRTRGNFSFEGGRLMEAMDRYIDVFTRGDKKEIAEGERRKSFDPPEGTAYSAISSAKAEADYGLVKTLESAIFKFAVGGQPCFVLQHYRLLIEVGVAALCTVGEDKAILDEPLMIQAGINLFSVEKAMVENMAAQENGGLGEAFEKLMLPAIQKRFPDILQEQLNSKGGVLKNYWVSPRSSYGVLALNCTDISSTIKWIEDATAAKFEGQVPPFCYPDTSIGPDVIFLMWNEFYTEYIATICQANYRKKLNQLDALRTITPSLLYCENRGKDTVKESSELTKNDALKRRWQAVKPKLVGQEHGCVRFMVQYPSYGTNSAKPGVLEDDKVKVDMASDSEPSQKKRKVGWLVTVHKGNAESLFQGDGLKVVKTLKWP